MASAVLQDDEQIGRGERSRREATNGQQFRWHYRRGEREEANCLAYRAGRAVPLASRRIGRNCGGSSVCECRDASEPPRGHRTEADRSWLAFRPIHASTLTQAFARAAIHKLTPSRTRPRDGRVTGT